MNAFTKSRLIPPTGERGVEQPPTPSTPQFRFINCDAQGFGILVEQGAGGASHARAARFFRRGR
jgi:hypothetical protein